MTAPTQTEPMPDLAYWLAVEHQAQQQDIAGKAAAGLSLLWSMLQFSRLKETSPAWLHAVTLQAEQDFRKSEQAAFDFVQGSKWAIEPLSDPIKPIKTVFPVKDFQLAMQATGPGSIKAASKRAIAAPQSDSGALLGTIAPEVPRNDLNALMDDIMSWGKLNSTGAAVKHIMNGGRGEVQQLVLADAAERVAKKQVIGWARFTEDSDTGPCYFCALLASQGGIYYDSTSFDRSNNKIRGGMPSAPKGVGQKYVQELLDKLAAGSGGAKKPGARRAFLGEGPAKVHDHCRCTLRPVYRESDGMDTRAKNFLKQWTDSTGGTGLSWQDKMKKFRRDYKRPASYADNPRVNLARVRQNRQQVADELGEDSPHVKWFDRTISRLEIAVLQNA